MKISLNELKNLVDIKITDNELFKLIGSRLVEIENVEDLAPKYKKIYIVKVKSADPIEGTHLHLCKIDAGKKLNAEIDPEHNGYIQVVCGAPNVKKDMLTAWIAPGAIVPASFNTPNPFEISARKLRGFMSFGMLAAIDELNLGENHDGIVSIHPNHVIATEDKKSRIVEPGDTFAEAFNLNDKIIEVENKSLTHRPDCFGLIGFAREVAGILGQKFELKNDQIVNNYHLEINRLKHSGLLTPLSIKISDYNICPRYEAYIIDLDQSILAEYTPSDQTTTEKYLTLDDIFLYKSGMRPISPLVDITNKIMLKTGQPLHAFDYDKFIKIGNSKTPEIHVRLARKEEKIVLLDNEEINLNENDIVICSNDTPAALAGAMGGKSTAIDRTTKKVIFEIASFSLYNLRKTQMSHGIFSEAITRFTKGRPASDLTLASMNLVYETLLSFPGSKLISANSNTNPELIENDEFIKNVIIITTEEINNLLGSNYPEELIIKTLENTNFEVKRENSALKITAPLWRADIKIKEDIIEEVGRLLGFDNLPLNFPLRPFVCASIDPLLELKSKIRNFLSDRKNFNEVLTYSFVSKNLQEKVNESPDDSYEIINSISPELECFRQSIVPSLLDKVFTNEKAGYKDFTLYELNQISKKSWGLNEENVPIMKTQLGLVTFGNFYKVKNILLELGEFLNLEFSLKACFESPYFIPSHSVDVYLGEEKIGTVGELKKSILKKFKLSAIHSALQIILDSCTEAKTNKKTSVKLSRFPSVSRDITFKVKESESFERIQTEIKCVLDNIEKLVYTIDPISIYKKETESTKNLSFHLKLANAEKTFKSEEVSDIIEKIVKSVSALGAEVV